MTVTILGNNSALPAYGRHPTAQIVTIGNVDLLLDCGEGTQLQMQHYGLKWRNIRYVFISHLHGDHYFGLPGLINSMHLLGRTKPLYVFGPAGLQMIMQSIMDVAGTVLSYPYIFTPVPDDATVLLEDTPELSVRCFPVSHRIACHGFLVTAKTKGRKLLPENCVDYRVPPSFYQQLKAGADFIRDDGFVVKNELVTEAGPQPKQYAYTADTLYMPSLVDHISGVDLLYHEATYLSCDEEKAHNRYHSTAAQAATTARLAGAGRLLLGHFSSRYKDLNPFLEEATAVFPDTAIAVEGMTYTV